MVRGSRTTFFEDLIELASLLPWKAGVAIAVVSYLGLHYVAEMPNVVSVDIRQMGASAGRQVFITMAMFMQYIIPVAFLVGAGLSAYKGRHKSRIVCKVQTDSANDVLIPETASSPVPSCPQCGMAMVRRIARKGANAGGEFWGCSSFPACKGIRR